MPTGCVHHLVEAQAARTPQAVAVVWDGGMLTYRELDERAGKLAALLASKGAGPERLVGVSMEPSPLLLVAMLAIWKAGGVYVPIDASLPRGVAEEMLADAGAVLFVRNGQSAADPSGVPVVDLDGLDLSGRPAVGPAVTVDPANLAYCVFTSGSTGKPKRVAVAHASFANHGFALRDELGLGPEDRSLQFTAMAFDAALEEILPAWLAGGAVVMPAKRQFTSVEFTELVDRLAVTMISLPSAYWHQWVDDLTSGLVRLPESLRVVFIGGDKILVEKLAAWYRVPGAERIDWVSDYGPTETSISVALHKAGLAGLGESGHALVPIGRPFANAVIHVLDDELRQVPADTPGDLWIGGPVLARGYHAAPALTADRFVPDPHGPPGARMYRTGDRGSRRPDGTLLFLGRSDRQVKIRGQRVEPGQVESAVHHCAGVRDACVIAVDDPPYGPRLVAYVEAEPGVSEAAVRADLAGRLPEAMVPGSIVLLDRIPRSPLNGKVARAELPPVEPAGAAGTAPAGMTALERVLAILVGDVLDGRPRGRDEDFFAAGGDSLRGLQLLSRITEVTGVALTFAQLRAASTVAGIAELVKQGHARGVSDGSVVRKHHHGDRVPASRGQQALWFLDRVHRGAPIYAVPVCYRIRGPLDLDRLDAALTAVVARHEALRTTFEFGEGKVWQRIRPTSPVRTALTVVDDHDKAFRLAEQEAARPFDLTTGPLLRSACFRVGAEESLWLLNVHHAVFDAWSLAVFWRELGALYDGRSLPEPATQYADYSAWQERWLGSAEADGQRAYWRARLAGDPAVAEPGSPGSGRVATEGFALELARGAVDPAAVEGLAHAAGTTAFSVLLAAFVATLCRTGGADEAVVGVPVACRNRPGTEDLIGYLVNTVAVRVRCPAGTSFRELVARTDEAVAEALTHQELPFADAVEALGRRGGPGENPLFQAMFSLQSTPVDSFGDIDGLEIAEQFVHTGTAKVALTWTVRLDAAGLAGEVEYSADRFDEASARHWQDALLAQLGAGLAEPDARIGELGR
ncbi:amino acid adenylation domain-containing protein [Lentzea xinjiangensis]|uniref:Amino acid adenylation domain-containing protein n=1 Tax=Lentzea xinjiangensis TaxID=402600 RepID=A0A1H9KR28_9PSEU|nr:non-ribosomal peptide synthetase [Lentzea xinjiangensis]SER01626.1 amino acid adenylation domain-containing protein [Lentzea xinjiangensis]